MTKLLSVIILTKDEELNLPSALQSLAGLDADIFVVDSGSADATARIATAAGARVVVHPFETHARQFNWALDTLDISTPWIMRLDADERLTPELRSELSTALRNAPPQVAGFQLRRRVYFWGRWIRHGGYYPIWLLRVWRKGQGRCEDIWMDEHVVVRDGEVRQLSHDIIDENCKGLSFWIAKHNDFSNREVRNVLDGSPADAAGLADQASRKRILKDRIYGKAPRFVRAFLYWVFRYFFLFGFLDGKPGLVFHFLQAFWYRFLIDAKLEEQELASSRACARLHTSGAE